ncbi:MAG: RHS repeat-associated core domain-containing protein [Planctomycetota bacterium]|nr:MAG: RHS repeat-associated core domain-containing protein [Planctomycetota bacterium]
MVQSDGTTITDSFSYDAYGVMLGGNPTSSPATSLLYAGEQFDVDAQMYYLRARYYNPSNGLFNRVDPFSGNNVDPQSLHKYLYAHGNPVNGIDPSGGSLLGIAVHITGLFVVGLIITYAIGRIAVGLHDIFYTIRGRCGTCGENISEKFRNLIVRINEDAPSTEEERSERCGRIKNIVGGWVVGWDIGDLFEKRVKGWTGSCRHTATLDDNCYSQGAINYYLWGRIARFCDFGLARAKSYVTIWKMFRGAELDVYEQTIAFTKAGYYGTTDFSSGEVTRFSFKNCEANNNPTSESLWRFHWGDVSPWPWDWDWFD